LKVAVQLLIHELQVTLHCTHGSLDYSDGACALKCIIISGGKLSSRKFRLVFKLRRCWHRAIAYHAKGLSRLQAASLRRERALLSLDGRLAEHGAERPVQQG
jgi:hypothetical protein